MAATQLDPRLFVVASKLFAEVLVAFISAHPTHVLQGGGQPRPFREYHCKSIIINIAGFRSCPFPEMGIAGCRKSGFSVRIPYGSLSHDGGRTFELYVQSLEVGHLATPAALVPGSLFA